VARPENGHGTQSTAGDRLELQAEEMIVTAPAGRTLLFKVTPWRDRHVSRTIELLADQTLHVLHHAIQGAFELDADHLYAFFLNNNAWDRTFEYGGPRVDRSPHQADSVALGALPLRMNKRILYLFDFGDDLRHEVRMVGEGTADANERYPRVVESVGAPPPQYPVFADDEGPDREESPPLDPGLAELVPGVMEALERYAPRRFEVGGAARPEAELRAEAGLAIALLERSAGKLEAIHALEHAVEGYVWGWLSDLPLELSLTGLAQEGLVLGERVHAILQGPPIVHAVPLLLALANRPGDAREHIDRNLAEYPDDPVMLLRAGATFHELGDLARAEEAYRAGLHWVGGNLRMRREIAIGLDRVLRSLGREDAVAELRIAEQHEQEGRLQERFGWTAPHRRQGPKVGWNDPCHCGSGKKAKRCCDAGSNRTATTR